MVTATAAAVGALYGVCWTCVRRVRVPHGETAAASRCGCGRPLSTYSEPAELAQPPRGIPVRLTRYWLAGREDGFWNEHRMVHVPHSQRERVDKRQARRTYAAGQRAGTRLRESTQRRQTRAPRRTVATQVHAA